jgi:hypothetical protein
MLASQDVVSHLFLLIDGLFLKSLLQVLEAVLCRLSVCTWEESLNIEPPVLQAPGVNEMVIFLSQESPILLENKAIFVFRGILFRVLSLPS